MRAAASLDRLLAIMIVAALVLGVFVGYSVLYLYPYQRAPQERAASTASTQITVPLEVGRASGSAVEHPPAEGGYGGNATAAPLMAVSTPTQRLRIVGAELLSLREDGGRIYFRIRLYMGGNLSGAEDLSVARVTLTPLPFPYAWNGSSWVYGADEERCLVRIALPVRVVSYSYNVSSIDDRGVILSMTLDLDRVNVYGKYGLSILVKLGSSYYDIAREIGLGRYRDPQEPGGARNPSCG